MKRRARIYLLILACAIAVWAPLYPIFYSLGADTSGLAVQFFETKPKYVYFGDSVLATSECETDTRSVVELLPNGIADQTIAFNRGGYDAEIWRYMTRFIAARGNKFVSAAIIPINMGAFSAIWSQNSSSEERMFFTLASGKVSVREYLGMLAELHLHSRPYERTAPPPGKKLLLAGAKSFGTFESADEELKAMPILSCNEDLHPYGRLLALRFAQHYGAPIVPGDPLLADIDEIAVSLRRAGIRPVIYLTPLNVDGMRRFGGTALLDQLSANLDRVRQVARAKGWNLIDLSGALPEKYFITRACACEHVNAAGRAFIANSVAAALQGGPPPVFPRRAADETVR